MAGAWTRLTLCQQQFWAATYRGCESSIRTPGSSASSSTATTPRSVEAAGFDSATQYELWKAIWSSLNDGNFFELDWALQRHNEFLVSFAPLTFIGNHDVTRIASQLEHPEHLAHALVILLTVGGVPSVYAGDELGFRGVKEERYGGDDAVRPEFGSPPMQLDAFGAEVVGVAPVPRRAAPPPPMAARGIDHRVTAGQPALRL